MHPMGLGKQSTDSLLPVMETGPDGYLQKTDMHKRCYSSTKPGGGYLGTTLEPRVTYKIGLRKEINGRRIKDNHAFAE